MINLPARRACEGQTLVIVLSFMMLMTVLVLVFFGSVMTDNTTSRASTGGVAARQLAQSAVQIVEAIITQATVPGSDTSVAWADQPGMIRTFGGGNGVASATPLAYYKLYSAPQMVVSNPNGYVPDSDVTTNWNTQTAFYTDLNAPIYDANNNLNYPIVDPRAQSTSGYTEPYPVQGFSYSSTTASGTSVPGVNNNVGSELLPMPVQWIYVLRDGTFATPTGGTGGIATFDSNVVKATNPIVGRIAFWTDDESSKVNLNTASEGTYWDTPMSLSGGAGGGTNNYDTFGYTTSGTQTGQTAALGDIIFANLIPAAHEYQRYPGHPATTCLSEVFGSLFTGASARPTILTTIDTATPRVTDFGVVGGNTVITSTTGGTQTSAGTVARKFDRLYSSVDDFAYSEITPSAGTPPPRQQQILIPGASQTQQAIAQTQQVIAQSHFFLTTSSKAPDLNPFGLPKITVWPIWDDNYAGNRSTLDGTILNCSTVANGAANGHQHRMIFQRENPDSSTFDYSNIPRNPQLYQYLQTLTNRAIPGYGGTFTSKYSTADRDQILTEIFDYIRCTDLVDQTGQNGANGSYTPSVSSTAAAPIGGANVRNGTGQGVPTAAGQGGQGEVLPIQITQGTTTQGMGRIATVAEVTLVLDKCDDRNSNGSAESASNLAQYVTVTDPDDPSPLGVQWCPTGGPGGTNPANSVSLPPLTGTPPPPANTYSPAGLGGAPAAETCLEWALFPKLSCPMAGYPGLANNIRIHYSNFQLQINGWTLNPQQSVQSGASFSSASPVFDQYDIGRLGANGTESTLGGVIGPQMLMEGANSTYPGTIGAPSDSFIPTGIVVVPGQSVTGGVAGSLTVSGSFIIQIYSPGSIMGQPGSVPPGTTPPGTLVQTIPFTIPTMTVPIPQLVYSSGSSWLGTYRSTGGYTPPPAATPSTPATFVYPPAYSNGAVQNSKRTGSTFIYGTTTTGDVSRSVVPTGNPSLGDLRVIALSGTVPSNAFATDLVPSGSVGGVPTQPLITTFNCNSERTGMQGIQSGMGQTSLCSTELASRYGQGKRDPDIGVYVIGGGSNIPLMNFTDGTNIPADWDNGPGLVPDGAYFNKVDEGTLGSNPNDGSPAPYLPYMYDLAQLLAEGLEPTQFFSPNQQLSSPVMFGSLLAGTDHPWRTLLFRPATLPGYQETNSTSSYTHPGGANPPDHVLLDFFRMPVVEPYAISEPLATAGKVNLNTQIVPFTYITRTTGLRAVLKSVMVTAFNPVDPGRTGASSSFLYSQKSGYVYAKAFAGSATGTGAFTTRYPIDLTNTINLLYAGGTGNPFALDSSNSNTYNAFPEFNRTTNTLTAPNFFIYPSQICDLPLIPLGSSITGVNAIAGIGGSITSLTGASGLGAFWSANSLTGDNSLERPYSLIYPRVTTQSNTFTVHVRAQSLQKVPGSVEPVTTWNDSLDKMTGEYRGSFTVEKYFDPSYAAVSTASGAVLADTDDATLPVDAAIRGDNNPAGTANTTPSTTIQHGALWRLIESKRFGQ